MKVRFYAGWAILITLVVLAISATAWAVESWFVAGMMWFSALAITGMIVVACVWIEDGKK